VDSGHGIYLDDASNRPVVVLVHGAWHGAWCWMDLQPALSVRGLPSVAVELPSTSRTRPLPAGLSDDADAVVEVLASIDAPVLLVAHSYGGLPATEAAVRCDNVAHLVYVAAFRLGAGESLPSSASPQNSEPTYLPVPVGAAQLFYNDLPEDRARELVTRLVPQSSRAFSDKLAHGANEVAAASYVICSNDHVLPPALQEQMATGIDSVSMPTGHSPFFVDPQRLADIIAAAYHGIRDTV
jgi:pimeloyl-ACP methyl ester carboxylesterase